MVHSDDEKGVILALLKRLVDFRLPRLLDLQSRVNKGELLTDNDIEFLDQALHDANESRSHIVKFPEYADVISKLTALYTEITSKALENQKHSK